MSILDSLLSVASGGITGLIGTAVQGYYTYQSKKLDIDLEKTKAANEIELRKIDIQMQAAEWASRTQIADITATAEVDKADAAALAASYATEPQQYSEKSLLTHAQNWIFVFLDAFKAVIRPGLTLYLCAITTVIYLQARALLGTDLPSEIAAGLVTKIIDTILFLTVTAVTWWYGSRTKVKEVKK